MYEALFLISLGACLILLWVAYIQNKEIQKIKSAYSNQFFYNEIKSVERGGYKESGLGELMREARRLLDTYRPVPESLSVYLYKKLTARNVNLDKFFKEVDLFDYESASATFSLIEQEIKNDI